MARLGRRHRIAQGIYRHKSGLAAVVQVRRVRAEQRYPPNTPLHVLQTWRRLRAAELDDTLPAAPDRGTLAALVAGYLARVPAAKQKDKRQLLQPWIDALGDRSPFALTRVELATVADQWSAAGLSASRRNKRISALRVAWTAMNADDRFVPPIMHVDRRSEPPPVDRSRPLDLVVRVLKSMPETKTRARLAVLLWTGQPPARVMAIEPKHVRWHAHPPELYVSPRRKGTGSADAWLPLRPEAVTALRAFFRAQATGRFSCAVAGRALTQACRAVARGLRQRGDRDSAQRLEGLRVYDLRHSFLTALATTSKDIYAVAEYGGHANLQTTRRYMRGAASSRMKDAIAALVVPRAGATPDPSKNVKGRAKTFEHVRRRTKASRAKAMA